MKLSNKFIYTKLKKKKIINKKFTISILIFFYLVNIFLFPIFHTGNYTFKHWDEIFFL